MSQFINKNPAGENTQKVAPYVPEKTFEQLAPHPLLLELVKKCGYTTPTPIQDKIIPYILEGKDVVGLANTGTGKTAAFLIPLINKALLDHTTRAIILAPTRELATQIKSEMDKLTNRMTIYSTLCVGGLPMGPQMRDLRKTNHVVIGTPGRVLKFIEMGVIKMPTIRTVILDEADRMLDMGFIDDMRKIVHAAHPNKQTLFFSATMSKTIEALVCNFLKNPITVSVKTHDTKASISQDVVRIGARNKTTVLAELLAGKEFEKVLVFGRTKRGVEKLFRDLQQSGLTAESIHGDKSHGQRQQALQKFKTSKAKILVATDVAARGLHIDDVSHVVNYDLPSTYEDYIHRIGRTGRGEKKGKALTLVP